MDDHVIITEATPLVDLAQHQVKDTAHYWGLLMLTIVTELMGTICMQQSDGFTNFWPSVGIFVGYGISFSVFPYALQGIELSVAYAVWSSAGIALTTIWGVFFAKESINWLKISCIVGILVCVGGLKYAEGQEQGRKFSFHG